MTIEQQEKLQAVRANLKANAVGTGSPEFHEIVGQMFDFQVARAESFNYALPMTEAVFLALIMDEVHGRNDTLMSDDKSNGQFMDYIAQDAVRLHHIISLMLAQGYRPAKYSDVFPQTN